MTEENSEPSEQRVTPVHRQRKKLKSGLTNPLTSSISSQKGIEVPFLHNKAYVLKQAFYRMHQTFCQMHYVLSLHPLLDTLKRVKEDMRLAHTLRAQLN